MNLHYADAEALLSRILTAAGLTQAEREPCIHEILDAEWRGKTSYGLELVPMVVKWHRLKQHDPRIVRDGPVQAFIEGGNSAGPVVAALAMNLALRKARETGIAIVGARNRWPWFVAGHQLRRAAAAGFVALTWSAGVSIVAPHGGSRPVFGTNPLGVAVPATNGPIVFDTAMTAGPASALRDAKQAGQPLPDGIALDARGRPTTDPDEARKGALLPFGGHRGSGLAMMVELLGGAWVGAKTGKAAGPRGFVILVASRDLFGFGDGLAGAAEGLIAEMRAAADPPDAVHIPGRGVVDFARPITVSDELHAALSQLPSGA
ncbi:MAG TPA: Ldh family oxidoreductase [Kofleriaceae bacterium]|nr:Ldh family oxidoreductase [Kofleriaceae bacterium]